MLSVLLYKSRYIKDHIYILLYAPYLVLLLLLKVTKYLLLFY